MRKAILRSFFFLSSCSIVFFSKTNASGPGAGYTSAPSESNCQSCHSGSSLQTSGTKWSGITLTGNFTGSGYIPDSTYTLTLKYVETGKVKWGYQITSLDANTNSPQGTFSNPDSRSQTYSASIGGKTRSYLGHTSTGSTGTDSVSWSIKWKAPSSNVGKIVFYTNLNVTNNNGSDAGDVVYAKSFTFSPSTLLPTAKAKIKDSVNCSGSALTFDATTTNSPTNYEWIFPNFTSPNDKSTSQNPTRTYGVGAFKAILRVKNSKGYSGYDTFNFTVVQGATLPQISPNNTFNLCKGDTLTFKTITPTSGHTYLWSTGATTQGIKVTDSGSYKLTVQNTNKCFRTSAITKIVWRAKPSILVLKSFSGDTICSNYPFTVATFINSGPADSFSFTSASGPYSKKDTLMRTLSSGSATYQAWAKNTFGCISPKSSITIQAKQPESAPVVSASNITYTTMRFNWTSVNKVTSYRISLDTGKTWLQPTLGDTGHYYDINGLIGNTTIQALVIANTSGQCTKSDAGTKVATTLTCNSIPYTAVPAKTTVCKNGTTEIVLHGLKGMKIGVKVDGNFKGTDTTITVTVPGTKSFQISVIDSAGVVCGYTNKVVSIKEDTVQTPNTGLGSISQFCTSSSSVSLPVSVTKNSSADSVIYYLNNAVSVVKTVTNHTYTVQNNDSIWVRGKNIRGCFSDPGNKTRVLINPSPNASFTKSDIAGGNKFIASQGGGKHSWKLDTFLARSGDSVSYNLFAQSNKSIKMVHTLTVNGCSSSDSLTFTAANFVGISNLSKMVVNIYPNPANDVLNVIINDLQGSATMKIFNSTGQLLQTNTLKNGQNLIRILALPAGVLHYQLISASLQTTGSIVIER